MSLSFWICALITLVNALLSLGFSIDTYRESKSNARTNSMYTIARSSALAVVCFVPLFNHSPSWLIATATTMIIVQFVDTLIGIKLKDQMKILGPFIVAVLNLLALVKYLT